MEEKEGVPAQIREYEVGYGKPPKDHQFSKGKSGNPKGRPKGTRNLRTDLSEEFAEKIQVKAGGRLLRVSKQKAVVKRVMADALTGKPRAIETVFKLADRYDLNEEFAQAKGHLSEDDAEILRAFEARTLRTQRQAEIKR